MNRRTFGHSPPILATMARGLLCAFLLLPAACERKPSQPPQPPPPQVTVSQPLRQNVTDYLELTGNTQAVRAVQLRARVEGYLDKVLFRDGEVVKKDQLLFLIQQNTYVAKLQQAEGTVLSQKAALAHAQTEYDRYTRLYGNKAAPQTDVENWHYQRDSAQAALLTAEAQRDLAKLDLGYTKVTAPFTGKIDRRLVDPGNLVGSGESTALAQLTQLDPLYVYFNVSESDLSPLILKAGENAGQGDGNKLPVFIGLANDKGYPHEGYLDFSATNVSTSTGTLSVRGVLPNPDGKMRPGQFARVRVPTGKERSALLVPREAIGFDELGSYLLLADEKNTVERRNVKLGPAREGLYVIEEGLEGGEWVIVKGILKALPGRQVTPERQAPAP